MKDIVGCSLTRKSIFHHGPKREELSVPLYSFREIIVEEMYFFLCTSLNFLILKEVAIERRSSTLHSTNYNETGKHTH